jgi:hypothetical protein
VGEHLGGVAQADGAQVRGERRQADLVVGALELVWRAGQVRATRVGVNGRR